LEVLCLSGFRKQWSVQWNKKQDESNVLIENYDRIIYVCYISTYAQISGVNLY
jgi:hypothetical protein